MPENAENDPNKTLIAPPSRRSFLQRMRNNFLTGIVVVAPFGITLYLTWTIVDYVDQQVLPQVLPLIPEPYRPENFLPFSLPGLGVLVFVLFLILIGSLIIGLVDNLLRPILVGRDTQMPDYLILLSTLGGLTAFGISGVVIGPIIAAFFLSIWEMAEEEYANFGES